MNSVLDGLRVRRLDAIQEEIVEMVDCNAETAIEVFRREGYEELSIISI